LLLIAIALVAIGWSATVVIVVCACICAGRADREGKASDIVERPDSSSLARRHALTLIA